MRVNDLSHPTSVGDVEERAILCPSIYSAMIGVPGAGFSSAMWKIPFRGSNMFTENNMWGQHCPADILPWSGTLHPAQIKWDSMVIKLCCEKRKPVKHKSYMNLRTCSIFFLPWQAITSCLLAPSVLFSMFPPTCLQKRTMESEMRIFLSNQ